MSRTSVAPVQVQSAGPAETMLELQGISKSFPGVKALDDVSLTLRRGEIHMLLGENGAGKSTLMKVLCGAEKADAGRILLDGDEVQIDSTADVQAAGHRRDLPGILAGPLSRHRAEHLPRAGAHRTASGWSTASGSIATRAS